MEALLKQFMGQMDKRFDQMEKRFDEVDARFETIDKRFDKVEHDIQNLTEEVRNNQTENRSHFKFIETKLDEHSRTLQVVADELKGMNIDITYLNRKTGEHDSSLNNLIQRYHS